MRTASERLPLVSRLAKIEGQVRAIRQMIEDDRCCADELNLASAVTSAIREGRYHYASQHLEAGIQYAKARPEGEKSSHDGPCGRAAHGNEAGKWIRRACAAPASSTANVRGAQ